VAVMAERARGIGRKAPLSVVLLALLASAAASGAVVFGAIGALGSAFPLASRAAVAGLGAVVVVYSLTVRPRLPWQRNVETPQRWLLRENLSVALLNGAALGAGVVTRIGFWLWWMLPLLVFEAGRLSIGLVAGAIYGGTRLGSSSLMTLYGFRTGRDPLLRIGDLQPVLNALSDVLTVVAGTLAAAEAITMLAAQ
jgi:hypothetical protein